MTQVALVASYRDGGLYFTRQDVKEAYENKKIRHPEKHVIGLNRHNDVGYGAGTGTIYDTSDFIHVETTTATLFTGVSTKGIFFNILKPQP